MKVRLATFSVPDAAFLALAAASGKGTPAKRVDMRAWLAGAVMVEIDKLVASHERTITPPLPFPETTAADEPAESAS